MYRTSSSGLKETLLERIEDETSDQIVCETNSLAMDIMPINIHAVGNAVEAVLWFLIAAVLFIAGFRSGFNRQKYWLIAVVLIAFGLSDVLEIQSGAWWRP